MSGGFSLFIVVWVAASLDRGHKTLDQSESLGLSTAAGVEHRRSGADMQDI